METDIPETEVEKTEEKEVTKQASEELEFEGTFYGFSEGPNVTEYQKYNLFSNVCIL